MKNLKIGTKVSFKNGHNLITGTIQGYRKRGEFIEYDILQIYGDKLQHKSSYWVFSEYVKLLDSEIIKDYLRDNIQISSNEKELENILKDIPNQENGFKPQLFQILQDSLWYFPGEFDKIKIHMLQRLEQSSYLIKIAYNI